MAKKTPLYEEHKKLGAKFTKFAGWDMPVSYTSILQEHQAVRAGAGIFDISHMGIIEVSGLEALPFLQYVTTNDVSLLEDLQSQYSILCNENGGVIDDILVYRLGNKYRLVVNACNTQNVLTHFSKQKKFKANIYPLPLAFLSLQGQFSEKIMKDLFGISLSGVMMHHCFLLNNILISRSGYTGEDGFELFIPKEEVLDIWNKFLKSGVIACGLGSRDTLRMEIGYPLYGQEYSAETSPFEAGYGWAVKFEKGDFIGKEALLKARTTVSRTLRGLKIKGRAIPRSGNKVYNQNEEEIGAVTSGTFSPTLSIPIALAYIKKEQAALDSLVKVKIRDSFFEAVIGKKKFIEI